MGYRQTCAKFQDNSNRTLQTIPNLVRSTRVSAFNFFRIVTTQRFVGWLLKLFETVFQSISGHLSEKVRKERDMID